MSWITIANIFMVLVIFVTSLSLPSYDSDGKFVGDGEIDNGKKNYKKIQVYYFKFSFESSLQTYLKFEYFSSSGITIGVAPSLSLCLKNR